MSNASNTISRVRPAGLVRPAIAAFCAVVAGACAPDAPDASPVDETEVESVELVQVPYVASTTSPEIAVRNLHASVQGGESRFERLGDVASAESLVASLHLRASILGSLSDLQTATAVAETAVSLNPEDAGSYELLATSLAALHRFDEADRALELAAGYGAEVQAERIAIGLARGDWQPALETRVARAAESSSYATNSDLAPALTAAGRFEEADAALVAALESYRDVSPFAVAWVQFQRGVLWGEAAGRSDLAEPLYEDAVRLVPDYVAANVHLAEIEAEAGRLDAAIERLRRFESAEDPEPSARLAEFLASVDEAEARRVATVAGTEWERWLATEELAFADHAAEYYLGAGSDAERALELALTNLENRATDRSYELAIGAALANGDETMACELLERSGDERHRAGLVELHSELHCGP